MSPVSTWVGAKGRCVQRAETYSVLDNDKHLQDIPP